MDVNKISKYDNNTDYESPIDTYFFLPFATLFVDIAYKLNLTPNQITFLSAFSTSISGYFIINKNKKYAVIFYLLGYFFDCLDGILARKYKMGTDMGAVYDMSSDIFTNFIIISCLIYTKFDKLNCYHYFILFLFSLGIMFCHGITEAIHSYKNDGNDNFYQKVLEKYNKKSDNLLVKIYINANKNSYNLYKYFFKEYNNEQLHKYINIFKYFGPGSFNMLIVYLLYYI